MRVVVLMLGLWMIVFIIKKKIYPFTPKIDPHLSAKQMH